MFRVYFLEVRNRIGLTFLSWSLTALICYCYKETLLFVFVKPLIKVYPNVFDSFIATDLTEIFSSYLFISFFVSNQLTLFFFVNHVVSFLSSALYDWEYKKLRSLVIFSFLLWLLNIIVLNSFMFSSVFNFFLSFQDLSPKQIAVVHFEIRIREYLNFYSKMVYFRGFSFQIFLIIFILLNSLSKKEKFVNRYRKLFFFLFFLIATIVSPPDVMSQLVLGFSFIIIFEFLILLTILLNNLNRNQVYKSVYSSIG
jgi:sec-independent protein translocase protein TatC